MWRICAAPSARLGHLALEGQGAFSSQCRMPTAWVIEAVDVLEDGGFGLPTRFAVAALIINLIQVFDSPIAPALDSFFDVFPFLSQPLILFQYMLIILVLGYPSVNFLINDARKRCRSRKTGQKFRLVISAITTHNK
jgi:hypothetical protein